MTFKAIAQLFILGCSWGLGFFMVEEVGNTIGSIYHTHGLYIYEKILFLILTSSASPRTENPTILFFVYRFGITATR